MWIELKYNYLSTPVPEKFSFGKNLVMQPDHHLGDEIDFWIECKNISNFNFVLIGGYFITADV